MQQKPFTVISGSGFGWGSYATLGEAIARRDYVRSSHPDATISFTLPGL